MIQKIFLCGAAFIFLSAHATRADEDSDKAKSGFAAAEWTINQLTRLELNDEGQLVLKRDHWELAAKRPLPKPKQDDRFGGRGGFGGGRAGFGGGQQAEQPPLEKLFNRLVQETGGSRGGSSSSNGADKRISASSKSLKATLKTTADSTDLEIEETVDGEQSLKLTDDKNTTRLFYRSPSTFVQILRSNGSVHVCSMVDGEVASWTGHSFAEVVQQHEDYFRNTLQPALNQITELPLDEALQAKVTASDKPVDFQPLEFEAGTLTEDAIGAAFKALVRFRLVDGRLRINRFFGDRAVLKQEIEKVSAEFQKSLDEAVARLNKLDASTAMIDELKNKLNWKRDNEQAHGFQLPMFAEANESDSLLESFNRMRALTRGGGGSSSGGGSYSSRFSGGQISGSISRNASGTTLQAKDSAVEIVVRETENRFELEIESNTGLLIINDQQGRPCSMLLVGGGECEFLQSESFVALANEHNEKYRERILPILNRYNISGLNPFGKDSVDAILQRLPSVADGMLDIETAAGETDAYVFPLLNDAEYLKILASRLEGDDQSDVTERANNLASP